MDKAPDAYRTISEVGEDLDIAQHVLRFWETRFPQIKPLKRGGGRRYYRPDDVELLKGIRHLLYREGYTIKGVQRILKEQGAKAVQAVGRAGELVPGLGPAVPDDSYEDFAPQPAFRGVEAPSLPLDLPPVSAPPEAAPARMQAPLTPAPYSAPMPPPAAAPRPDEGHVSYTRGGLAPRPAFSPVPEPTEAALASTGAPSNAGMRQALLDALGELESARAAIGQVLANRDRLSSE